MFRLEVVRNIEAKDKALSDKDLEIHCLKKRIRDLESHNEYLSELVGEERKKTFRAESHPFWHNPSY